MPKIRQFKTQVEKFSSISKDKNKAAACLRIAHPKLFNFSKIILPVDQCDSLLTTSLLLGFETRVIRDFVLSKHKIFDKNLFIVNIGDKDGNINLDAPSYLFFKDGDYLHWVVRGDKLSYPYSFIQFIQNIGLNIDNIKDLYNLT